VGMILNSPSPLRISIGAGGQAVSEIVFRALIMVAIHGEDICVGQLSLGFDGDLRGEVRGEESK
jgi:hypothetical protein